MFSYITKSQCAKKCVAESVDGNIAVRVCYAADGAFDLNAAEPKRKSFSQSVYVVSVSNSDVHIHEIISTKIKKKH